MQKIQGDFHKLEADQVELFASQMKKHQALILSIHRQMRHIDVSPAEHPAAPPSVAPKVAPTPATTESVPVKQQKTTGPAENKQKKVSFLSRIGISKDPEASEDVVRRPAVARTSVAPPPPPPVANTERPSRSVSPHTIAETPPPVKKQPEVLPQKPTSDLPKTPVRKKIETIRPSEAAESETVKKTAKSTITIPESAPEQIIRPPRQAAQTLSGMIKIPETKAANVADGIPIEGSAPPSVNDAIEKRKLSDLRKAFSLNDRFLYRRELFGGSEDVMNKVITALNSKTSYQESIRFLEEKLHWDFTLPIVKSFVKILEIRFL
jgi:hypothetical protein